MNVFQNDPDFFVETFWGCYYESWRIVDRAKGDECMARTLSMTGGCTECYGHLASKMLLHCLDPIANKCIEKTDSLECKQCIVDQGMQLSGFQACGSITCAEQPLGRGATGC